jgi:hypothetical protein
MTISGNTPWIQQTLMACKKISENNDTLLTSVGQNTWNFQVFCGSLLKLKMRIIVPANDRETYEKLSRQYGEQFNCDKNTINFTFLEINSCAKKNINQRDQFIIDNSEIIYPISLRKNGFFYNALKNNINVDKKFEINYSASSKKERKKNYQYKEIKNVNTLGNYLFHWTRNPRENWPDEKQFEYYMSIIKNQRPRTAFDTLCNILDSNLIYSSSRHALKNCKIVSFTGASINQFFRLMKWRKRYNEMSYEPYGIGIDKDEALKMGFTKVIYCDQNKFLRLNVEEKKIFHSSGKKTNWSDENEYRFFGDLDLTQIPNEMKICVCQNSDESSYVEKKYGIKSYSLY